MKKLLIGSCGGLAGYYLTKLFKQDNDLVLFGTDAGDPLLTGKLLKDVFKCPSTVKEDLFVENMIKILNENQIDYYLPTHSKETRCISKNEDEIRSNTNARFVISPYETFLALDNKKSANSHLQKAGVDVPKIFNSEEDARAVIKEGKEIFMKPIIGSGSHNSFKIASLTQFELLSKLYPGSVFMQAITGKEYTADILFDSYGNLVCYNQRIRAKQAGGATVYTYNDYSVDIKEQILKISSHFQMKGVVNFQFILADEIPYFTDINLRYASGGLPLSVHCGMDLNLYLLEILDGKSFLDVGLVETDRRKIAMYRNYEETYELLY